MSTLNTILVFIIGSIVGSFLSVVIHRLEKGEGNIVIGRSKCPKCKKKLKGHHLIPVLSWLFLGGKCAHCRKKISWRYIALELISGSKFAVLYLQTSDIKHFIFYTIIFSFMILIFFYDLEHGKIPDRISLPAILVAIIGTLMLQTGLGPAEMFLGALVIGGFFMAQFIISSGKWIGGGDVRLGALIGVLLGWQSGLAALMIAYFLGAIGSIALLSQGMVTRKSSIPFGPFLVLGFFFSFFYGEILINWYLGSTF